MQDRLTYANGNTITTEGFRCTVGEAIYDDEVVANENGEAFLSAYVISGFNMNSQYLVTLEVNGVSKLYRELWTSGDYDYNNTVPMGEYTFTMDETVITGLTEGDHVRIKIEPVTVKTTDAFRAAVAKVAPKAAASGGGGTGGGVLVVHDVDGTLDKTWSEIDAADVAVIVASFSRNGGTFHTREFVFSTLAVDGDYIVSAAGISNTDYLTDSADGYPVRQQN